MLPPLDAGDVSAPYWNGILIAVLQHLMEVQLPVWPVYSQDRQEHRFLPLDSLLIIPPELSKNIDLCNALSSASLDLLAIPEEYVNRWNAITSIKGARILTPLEAGAILRVSGHLYLCLQSPNLLYCRNMTLANYLVLRSERS